MSIAKLALEDGTILIGEGFGAKTTHSGEIVFSTSMTGYVEALTDPSYKGQILMATYPLQGNYGVSHDWFQSEDVKVEAFVTRQICYNPTHHKSEISLPDFLKEEGIPGISGIDTRKLTLKIREHGSMKAAVSTEDISDEKLLKIVNDQENLQDMQLVKDLTVKEPKIFNENGKYTIALIDCGVKYNMINELVKRDCKVIQVPSSITSEELLSYGIDGVMLSSGPGNPENVDNVQETIKSISDKVPIYGICLGMQIIALAHGATTYKMKFGHRGSNQPVKNVTTGKVSITSQNHSFAIDKDSLEGTGFEITHVNLNDGTPEGLKHETLPIACMQYHPEAGPGPHDTKIFFDDFLSNMDK